MARRGLCVFGITLELSAFEGEVLVSGLSGKSTVYKTSHVVTSTDFPQYLYTRKITTRDLFRGSFFRTREKERSGGEIGMKIAHSDTDQCPGNATVLSLSIL